MKAAIDIGTNTVLLLIGSYENDHLKVVHQAYRIPRLGKGVDEHRTLHSESIDRVMDALFEYKSIIEQYPKVEDVKVTATSAVRDAENRTEFLDKIKMETGWDVTLLSGDEEAQYTYRGALSAIENLNEQPFVVLDIGGGSTEIAFGNGAKLETYTSIDMGCVRFTERFLGDNPPTLDQIAQCREAVQGMLENQRLEIPKDANAVGVAGTVTTLAAIEMKMLEPEMNRLNGFELSLDSITRCIEKYGGYTYEQLLEESPEIMKGREDIILAGMLILEGFLKYYSLNEIVVSIGGIRHGALMISEKD